MIIAAGGSLTIGYGFGVRSGGHAAPVDAKIEWAMAKVHGPRDELVEHYRAFLETIQSRADVPAQLWEGVLRLASIAAEAERADAPVDRAGIASLLVECIEANPHPPDLEWVLPELKRIAGSLDRATPLPETNDPRVLWARGIADDSSPISELIRYFDDVLLILQTRAPHDPLLWRGAERLCWAAIEGDPNLDQPTRRALSSILVAHIVNGSPPPELRLESFLATLRRLGR